MLNDPTVRQLWLSDLRTILISVATTLITFWLTSKWKKRQDKGEAKETELSQRLNPDLNIRREYKTVPSSGGSVRSQRWLLNPYWIFFDGDKPKLRNWPEFDLMERRYGDYDDDSGGSDPYYVPLNIETIQSAIDRREWLRCREKQDSVLLFWETEPATAEDRHLFQPLPEPKKGLLKRS